MSSCFRCGADSSVFWHRVSYGCDAEGNHGMPFLLCDRCMFQLTCWIKEGKNN